VADGAVASQQTLLFIDDKIGAVGNEIQSLFDVGLVVFTIAGSWTSFSSNSVRDFRANKSVVVINGESDKKQEKIAYKRERESQTED
jgi:hypothetical protein